MLEDLTQELVAAKENLRKKNHLESSLAGAHHSLREQRERLRQLRERLAAEEADVQALKESSLRRLFHAILGNREERVEKERREVLAAKLKYDECREGVAALEDEVTHLRGRIDRLGDAESRYQALLRHKEEILRQENSRVATNLLQLSEAQADARSDLRELREAISAGEAVLGSLDSVISALRGAETWGTVDLLGGGILITAAKHGRVDEARHRMHRAQQELRRFRRELCDLESDVSVGIDIGGFETFADFFFDGLIADWIVQSSIKSSLDRAVEMQRRVRSTLSTLQRQLNQARRRKEQIERTRRELIERA